jgi:hypothetical protein
MASFQKIVLVIATIILVLLLVFVAFSLHYSKHNQKWPPMVSECPDYWVANSSGKDATCTNVKNLGSCPIPTGQEHLVMNFNTPAFRGTNSLCSKYMWAKNCGISWDGITYGAKNPCQI